MFKNLNGLLLIDKPVGPTSHDLVDEVRRLLRTSEVGHCGTLDPFASGLMVMLIGQATKLSDYVLSQDKTYRVTLRMGVETDSGDRTGKVVTEAPFMATHEQVESALLSCEGEMDLPVPVFSAVKVDGKKLYEFAHKNKPVAPPKKTMRFYSPKLVAFRPPYIDVDVSCGKGGYIRSWGPEVGRRLNSLATVEELRRLRSEPYGVDQAVTLEQLAAMAESPSDSVGALGRAYVPLAEALPGWRSYTVKGREEVLLRNGQISFDLVNRLIVEQKSANASQSAIGIKILGDRGELVGLLEALPAKGLKIKRIFAFRES